ncbi:alpha/beta hydrolase [Kribbella sp. NPDC026611]|uniref:alpha/beta fold hydrolase n=1 Tax=Kribbella sp. NPDC026611 TaxID=3154911 RepID=UPI0033E3EF10
MFGVRGETAHLAWYRTGEAAAEVAFLHGFSDSARCWEPLLGELPGIRALAIDARGHGESGLPDEPIRYAGHRDDAALVLSSQPRDGGVVVVGHSMGAMAAAYLAASRPELVRAVVLEDPPPGGRREQPAGSWSEPQWLADLRALDLPARIARGRSADPGWPEDELEPWAVSKAQVNPHLFDLPFEEAAPLTDLLAATTCPVLLIHGDTDRGSLISPDYAARCAEAAAGDFHAVHIPGAGHSIHRDNRPQYVAELTTFLDHHRSASLGGQG